MLRMRYLVLVAFALALNPALAAAEDTGPGCGLGTQIFQGNKKVVHQLLAVTTNGSFGNQTFGITSQTSGCTNDGIVQHDQKVNVFASANFENLSQEMARGNGEYLASFAALLGVPAERQPEFFALTQAKYSTLFQSEQTTPSEMLIALRQEMADFAVR